MAKRAQGSNHQTIRADNAALFLQMLYLEGPLSRTDLARKSGLSKMTITNRIQEMIEAGTIREIALSGPPVEIRSGRRPIQLEITPNAIHMLSLYISRDRVEASVVNWRMEEKSLQVIPLTETSSSENFQSCLFSCIDLALAESGLNTGLLAGIGVATIGPLDAEAGIILNPPNFHGLEQVPIRDWLQQRYGLPVTLDNDMNASALAELLLGKGKGLRNFLYVGITNGIGSGVILQGRLYRGIHGYAGEIGHTTIDINGPRCACGNYGCLELSASVSKIVLKAQSHRPGVDWMSLVQMAKSGDFDCLGILSDMCRQLAAGLVSAINAFDPQAVFLGHEFAQGGDWLLTLLIPEVHARLMAVEQKSIPLALSAFLDRTPVKGGAALVLDRLLHPEHTIPSVPFMKA